MYESILRKTGRRALIALVAHLRTLAAWIERVAERPASPLPAWADAGRVDAAWARASRRSVVAVGTAALVIATSGTAAAAFHASATPPFATELARSTHVVPTT